MSGRQKQGAKHCKAAAQRIYAEAEIIAARLAEGQSTIKVAQDYDCHYSTLGKRWGELIRTGLSTGPRRREAVSQAKPKTEPGPTCSFCGQPYTPGALKCTNCGNLFYR